MQIPRRAALPSERRPAPPPLTLPPTATSPNCSPSAFRPRAPTAADARGVCGSRGLPGAHVPHLGLGGGRSKEGSVTPAARQAVPHHPQR